MIMSVVIARVRVSLVYQIINQIGATRQTMWKDEMDQPQPSEIWEAEQRQRWPSLGSKLKAKASYMEVFNY